MEPEINMAEPQIVVGPCQVEISVLGTGIDRDEIAEQRRRPGTRCRIPRETGPGEIAVPARGQPLAATTGAWDKPRRLFQYRSVRHLGRCIRQVRRNRKILS